jgi:hypothetical protein
LETSAVLGFGTGFFDFRMTNGVDAGHFLALSLFLRAAALFFVPQAALFGIARDSLRCLTRFLVGLGPASLIGLLFADSVFLEVHQLLEGEENRAFLLFGHYVASLLGLEIGMGRVTFARDRLAYQGRSAVVIPLPL